MADKLCALAEEDEARGRMISAGDKYGRAATYYLTAERLQAHSAPGRGDALPRFLDVFARGIALAGENCERVEIPYGEKSSGCALRPRRGRNGPRADPGAGQRAQFHQGDEISRRPAALAGQARRLLADRRSTRHRRSAAVAGSARPSTIRRSGRAEIVDWLEARDDVDAGAHRHARAFRSAATIARARSPSSRASPAASSGAPITTGATCRRSGLQREGNFPVPHYWEHVRWVWGAATSTNSCAIAENVHLDGVLDRIKVPFLVTHGEKDSQIPLQWAHRTYEQLVNSPKRELKIFTEREGGCQHSSFDNSANAGAYIADWVAETLGGRTAIGPPRNRN